MIDSSKGVTFWVNNEGLKAYYEGQAEGPLELIELELHQKLIVIDVVSKKIAGEGHEVWIVLNDFLKSKYYILPDNFNSQLTDQKPFHNLPHGIFKRVENNKIVVGMSNYDVAKSWGEPTEIRTFSENEFDEIWYYVEGAMVRFNNKKVNSHQGMRVCTY